MTRFCRALALASLALVTTGRAAAQVPTDTVQAQPRMPELRRELLAMMEVDQKIRNEMIGKFSSPSFDTVLLARMDSLDRSNTLRIKEIIHRHGWPGKSLVGGDGARAAFLIVQHSPDTLFQRQCLDLMRAAFKLGEASGPDFALLLDRVRISEGKPQVYGSQAKLIDGKLVFEPIEDEANVDKRREEVGLPPLAEYLKLLKQYYRVEEK